MKKALVVLLFFLVAWGQVSWAVSNPLKVRGSAVIGFDNNPGLNAERDEDFFGMETAKVLFRQRICKPVKLRLFYDVMNVNYFEQSEEDLLIQEAGVGLDTTLSSYTTLETDYSFKYALFHDEGADDDGRDGDEDLSTYWSHDTRAGLRHRVTDALTAKGGVGVSWREYGDRKARLSDGLLSDSEERSDDRYIADSEFIFKIAPAAHLRGGFVYTRNDSNDEFHDTYDYDSYKWFTRISLKPCAKTTLSLRLSYENRDYDSRTLLDDPTVFQDDDIYSAMGALYYKLHRNVSLGLAYTYRQRNSNEPSQSYSGSISTIGFYFNF